MLVQGKHLRSSLPFLLVAGLSMTAWSAVVNISGGGTDVLYNAIQANLATGATLLITDNANYVETQTLLLTPRYDATNGRRAFHIETAAGANPTITLNGGSFVAYSGGADAHLGIASGGRLKVDARTSNAAQAAIWYIGQENGLASGTACQLLIENVDLDLRGKGEGIVFGAGGNDGAPNTNGASVTLRDVATTGGDYVVRSLYGPASYASVVNVEGSRIIESLIGLELGALGLGGPASKLNVTNSILYTSSSVSGDSNTIIGRIGQTTVDHCDVVNEASLSSRGVLLLDGTMTITNSIVHGDVGTVGFGGTGIVIDSNVSGRAAPNVGFTPTNVITEGLADTYVAYGPNFTNPDNFRVKPTAISYSHGASPPLGSVGGEASVIEVSGGGTDLLYNAILSATKTGGTIEITDDATYTETKNLLFGQRNSAVYGRRSFNLQASPGKNPKIVLSGNLIAAYSGSKDFKIGSNEGGRISIDGVNSAAGAPSIWYIGQEDGLASGIACQMTLENLDLDLTDRFDAIGFGAGGNDEAPKTSGASLTIRNCEITGGGSPIWGGAAVKILYKPDTYASKVTIEDSQFINSRNGVELGAFQFGGDQSILEMTRTIIFMEQALDAGDSNCLIGRLGHMDLNHCDLINEATNANVAAARGIVLVQALAGFIPSCSAVNTIIYGEAGTANLYNGAGTATDCNVTGRIVVNVGFNFINTISELPADTYLVHGTDFSNEDNFRVKPTALSYSHGASPPLGAVGGETAVSDWALY